LIKFYRKIRQKMLTENKFSKYLLYAVGEIVLVVIGILIALQINNWNESRKQSISENAFITSVKKDLKEDKDYTNLVIELIKPRIEAYKSLDNGLPNLYNNDKKSLDSIF